MINILRFTYSHTSVAPRFVTASERQYSVCQSIVSTLDLFHRPRVDVLDFSILEVNLISSRRSDIYTWRNQACPQIPHVYL
ncbi:hypothetical protein BD779DRAFT_433973 [Infundibulicybe gibba]|nr:hypothetical protein BD779DRAFT_433973 [Infundibulicybe gibba]